MRKSLKILKAILSAETLVNYCYIIYLINSEILKCNSLDPNVLLAEEILKNNFLNYLKNIQNMQNLENSYWSQISNNFSNHSLYFKNINNINSQMNLFQNPHFPCINSIQFNMNILNSNLMNLMISKLSQTNTTNTMKLFS